MSDQLAGNQWVAILMPCLVGPSQQVEDALAPEEMTDYLKVPGTIFQTLNLRPEVYCQWLGEVAFGPDCNPSLIAHKIRMAGLRWLCPAVQMCGCLGGGVHPGRTLHFLSTV